MEAAGAYRKLEKRASKVLRRKYVNATKLYTSYTNKTIEEEHKKTKNKNNKKKTRNN